MRIKHVMGFALAGVALVSTGDQATAQGNSPAGIYSVKFDEVANSCTGDERGLELESGLLEVTVKDRSIWLELAQVPIMKGALRGDKISATSTKTETAMRGITGRFTAAGKIGRKGGGRATAELVLIAEYFRGDRPICAQSWNVAGPRR